MTTAGTATFREAQAPVEPQPLPEAKNPDKVISAEPETPIALYQELKGKPYSADYFEMGSLWNDHPSWGEDLSAIDSYYRSKVASGEFQDSKDSYLALIKEAEKATNTKNASTNLKVAKIAEFVRFMEKMDKIETERSKWQ